MPGHHSITLTARLGSTASTGREDASASHSPGSPGSVRLALADRLAAERDRQVRLADAGRTQEQERGAVGDPTAHRRIAELGFVERRLDGEVEAVEVAHRREVGDLDCDLDAPLVLARDIAPRASV